MKKILAAAMFAAFAGVSQAQSPSPSPSQRQQPAAVAASAASRPFLGHTKAQALRSDFVQFFHLALTQEFADPVHADRIMGYYGTTGPFKGAVNLLLSTKTGEGEVLVAALMIRRDFIDDPRTQTFARDIAKAFLDMSTGFGDDRVQALRDQIWTCQASDVPGCDATPAGYDVYLGQRPKIRFETGHGYVMLQNATIASVPMLFIENGP